MPIAKGKITSCRKNRKGFKLDDGNWYSRPDGDPMTQLDDWRENGTVIEIDYFEKDGWKNFSGEPKVAEEAPAQETQTSGGKGGFKKGGKSGGSNRGGGSGYKKEWHAYEDREWQEQTAHRIAKQSALSHAVSLVNAALPATVQAGSDIEDVIGPNEVDLVTTVANLFLQWIEGDGEG